ncbi:MAG: VOC family protein [Cyclobacteriaceae bacterium]|nr:VOC family protein [Cyclobacteriaceae bacterium]
MKNLISIIEIPVVDFKRATKFYQTILNIRIEEVDMGEFKMGTFPANEEGIFVHLIQGSNYKPSADGPVVYLNGSNDLQTILNKVTASGGTILVPKTEIAPEMGYYAQFTDSEGNRLGLHSYQ